MPSSQTAAPSVAVVIPARNEAATVGDIVRRLRADLIEGSGTVREVIVIDSDSTDDTAAVAAGAGAVVHAAKDIRPDLGPARGKGEALWKSLFVTDAEILVFVDADLLDWGTHFVTELLQPLLDDPQVHLVKAVYHRPMVDSEGREQESGGRVTELVARPLLALHWPELAGIVQPLSGEWAVRREAFARLSVPVGYGVEIAALVDTYLARGSAAIAQADLGRRTHRHHRHDTLGPMAVQVLAAAQRRLEDHPAKRPGEPGGLVPLRQFDPVDSGFIPRVTDVDIRERPPAATVPGYRAAGSGMPQGDLS